MLLQLPVRFAAVDEPVHGLIPEEGPLALVYGAPGDVLDGFEVASFCPADLNVTHTNPFLSLYVVRDDLLSAGGL